MKVVMAVCVSGISLSMDILHSNWLCCDELTCHFLLADKKEYVIRTTKNTCDCRTYTNISICEHLIRVIKMRGKGCFDAFLKSFTKHQKLVGEVAGAGAKPTTTRRGGRNKPRVSCNLSRTQPISSCTSL